ncbi:hypothetical protein TNCV_1889501 [Trichonephila clavipes]|nr:hypothetical protein TNCV_1889501 [Trichonephila clavipes]
MAYVLDYLDRLDEPRTTTYHSPNGHPEVLTTPCDFLLGHIRDKVPSLSADSVELNKRIKPLWTSFRYFNRHFG